MKINKLLESKKLKEGYSHFEFTSGANPYIAKTKDEVERIKRSRGDSVKYVGNINGIDYYKVDDSETESDLFRFDESIGTSIPQAKQLKQALQTFDRNGRISERGAWKIANGGYDEEWELYYEGTPVARSVAHEISLENNTFDETLIDFIKSVYTDYVNESKQLNETEYGKDELWNQINNNEWAYNSLANKVKTGIENGTPKERIVYIVRNAIASMRNDFGRIPTTQAERLELARDFVEDELQGYSFEDGDMSVPSYKRTGTWKRLGESFKPSDSGIQSVKCYNRYNYTIQELRVDNDNKTFERGNFTAGKADKKTKNRQEFEDIVDTLKELGYTEIKSDYRSMRNKSRKGTPTDVEEGYELSPRIDYNPNPLRDDEGKIMADRWYASKWPDDEVGIEQLQGITLDDALKDRSILGHCDTQVRERVYAQLDKYIPLSVDSPMYKEKNESKESEESELITQYINRGEFDKLEKVHNGTNVVWKLKEPLSESLEVATIADYIVDHYDFDDIDDKYSCINSIRDSFKDEKTISKEELEQFIGSHNGRDKVNESVATHCVYFTQDGIEQVEFEGTEDECYNYIASIESEQDDEFGDEWPERYIKRLTEASYGGAFDIRDDQYFTRDDIENAAEEVLNHIAETFVEPYQLAGTWFENGKWIVAIQDEDEYEYEAEIPVDMRRIKEPWHLKRAYALDMAAKLISQIKETNESFVGEDEYDDDFDADIAHSNLCGGDTMYCRDCGTKKKWDDGYSYCPKCNEITESKSLNEYYEFIKSKSVKDMDGFNTDYTMYKDVVTDKYVFVFGDNDIYGPEEGYFDWECDTEAEAEEWFNSYNGFDDEDDDFGWAINEEAEEKSPIVHKKGDGSYMVATEDGKGYVAYNKNDECMGNISASNENEAKSKFNANQFDE